MDLRLLVAFWGFAEATLFFVVPDVLITRMALDGMRRGLMAGAWALAGSFIGGIATYFWASHDADTIHRIFDWLPAIGPMLMNRVATELSSSDAVLAILRAPFVGVPYKLYAAAAPAAGLGLAAFLLISLPARAVRFGVLAFVAATIGHRWRWSRPALLTLWVALWALNYAIYWGVMPN